jgi:hypothetical protein
MSGTGRLFEKWSGIDARPPGRRSDAKQSSDAAEVRSAALRDRWQNGRGTCWNWAGRVVCGEPHGGQPSPGSDEIGNVQRLGRAAFINKRAFVQSRCTVRSVTPRLSAISASV